MAEKAEQAAAARQPEPVIGEALPGNLGQGIWYVASVVGVGVVYSLAQTSDVAGKIISLAYPGKPIGKLGTAKGAPLADSKRLFQVPSVNLSDDPKNPASGKDVAEFNRRGGVNYECR